MHINSFKPIIRHRTFHSTIFLQNYYKNSQQKSPTNKYKQKDFTEADRKNSDNTQRCSKGSKEHFRYATNCIWCNTTPEKI